jgi:lipoprotein-anchoring transpeptidase ErfK/SrfK
MRKRTNIILRIVTLLMICLCFSTVAHATVTVNVNLTKQEKRTITYKAKQKIQLLRYGQHIRKATYKSSNPNVATVSSTGLIRAKKPGKTTITVNARGYTAKYRLKVTKTATIYDIANKNARNMRYFIYLNRDERKVYVFKKTFGEYRLIKKFPCCVGAPGTPTLAGNWSIRGKGTYFITDGGSKCWYYSQFIGSQMFHSQIYAYSDSPSRIVDGSMGVACSHGCVRLYLQDAKWIYDTIPYGTRVYVV